MHDSTNDPNTTLYHTPKEFEHYIMWTRVSTPDFRVLPCSQHPSFRSALSPSPDETADHPAARTPLHEYSRPYKTSPVNPYLIFVLAVLVARYLLSRTANFLNVRSIRETVPAEMADIYNADRYRLSQKYLADQTRAGAVSDTVITTVTVLFIILGGFEYVDRLSRLAGLPDVPTGLIFAAILGAGVQLLGLPFDIHDTFVLEARYGFNRTTWLTFVMDCLKGLMLLILIGAPILVCILWFFENAGPFAWLYAWVAVTVIQFIIVFLAPYVIMPLFNKYEPLEDGPVRSAIESYARAQNFRMKGVFKMDGSKRSSKTNAFFTGFGASRRIVLFDTILARHSPEELVAIVAHEMGHYRKRHIQLMLVRSTATTGLMFAIMSLFLDNREFFAAFRMTTPSVYAGVILFGFLYSPIGVLLGIAEHWISRAHETEADDFAARTTGRPDAMVSALKKLSVDNLSNLTPHPMKVFLAYSHPPVLERVRNLTRTSSAT